MMESWVKRQDIHHPCPSLFVTVPRIAPTPNPIDIVDHIAPPQAQYSIISKKVVRR